MSETFNWIAVFGAGGGISIITFITFWMTLASRITKAESLAENAKDDAKQAGAMASTAIAKCELMSLDHTNTKVDLSAKIAALQAESQAMIRSLTAAENRLAASIEGIGKQLENLYDTIITTFGGGRYPKGGN